jgi:hypothetical protein
MGTWEGGLVILGAIAGGVGGPILGITSSVVVRGGPRRAWMDPSILLVAFIGVTVALVGVAKLVTVHGVLLPLTAIVGGSVLALAATNIGRQIRDESPAAPPAISTNAEPNAAPDPARSEGS